jgi:glutamine synthetase type III
LPWHFFSSSSTSTTSSSTTRAITESKLPLALKQLSSRVLDDAAMRATLGGELYAAFASARDNGTVLDKATRRALAARVREWAQAQGATGYAHWFSPVRGAVHGEKTRHICFS